MSCTAFRGKLESSDKVLRHMCLKILKRGRNREGGGVAFEYDD